MGLREVQRGLAILLTDEEMRERFAADPQGAGRTLQLEVGDVTLLATLADAEVERFARSLRAKRWNEVQKLLPLSTQVAQQSGFSLRRAFLQFAQEYTPQGSKRHAHDALAFAEWVALQPKETFQNLNDTDGAATVPWLPDLLRYEAAWLKMQITPFRRCLLRRFAYPVSQLAQSLSSSARHGATWDDVMLPRSQVAVWLRVSPNGRLRHYCMSLPVYPTPILCARASRHS